MNPLVQVIKNFLGSEKAMAALGVLLMSSLLLVLGKISPEVWLQAAVAILGVYTAGKAWQGAAAMKAKGPPQEPEPIEPTTRAPTPDE